MPYINQISRLIFEGLPKLIIGKLLNTQDIQQHYTRKSRDITIVLGIA